ncbi:phage holin, LLH family [Secundilactobacillus muriivasis]
MDKFFQTLNDSGIFEVLGVFLTAVVLPWLKQAHANAKNSKIASAYDVLDKVTEGAVALMSTEYEKTSQAKHDQAVATIESQLAKKGVKGIDAKDIDLTIEKAYQYFTTTDTKSQAKQAEFNAGLAEAEKVSAEQVAVTPEPSTDDVQTPADEAEEPSDKLTELYVAQGKIEAAIAKIKGSDDDATV